MTERAANREHVFEHLLEDREGEGARAVAGRLVRVLVHFGEERVDAGGDRRAGEQRHELPLARGLAVPADGSCTEWVASKHIVSPASRIWASPRMSTTRLLYPKDAPRSVTRTLGLPASHGLSRACTMSPGATNWPFLRFTPRPVRATADDQVGLPAEEGRDLKDVHHLGDRSDLRDLVDVGEQRHPGSPLTRRSTRSPSSRPGPRKDLTLVRLALSKLHLKTNGTPCRLAGLSPERVPQHVLLALDDVRAGDDEERLSLAHLRPGELDHRAAAVPRARPRRG